MQHGKKFRDKTFKIFHFFFSNHGSKFLDLISFSNNYKPLHSPMWHECPFIIVQFSLSNGLNSLTIQPPSFIFFIFFFLPEYGGKQCFSHWGPGCDLGWDRVEIEMSNQEIWQIDRFSVFIWYRMWTGQGDVLCSKSAQVWQLFITVLCQDVRLWCPTILTVNKFDGERNSKDGLVSGCCCWNCSS